MASGRLAKAGRGELAVPLPAGYARRPSGEAALDPDEQVQAAIRLVFRLFDELGTVHAVLRFLVEHQVRIGMRERSGPVGFLNLVTVFDMQRHGWAGAVMRPFRTRGSARRGPFAAVFSPPSGRWSWPW